ncbi:TraB/GumN family protein [Sphingomicrobium sp. XHP0239]|uniref:TraB/GumN family protein n=1 Tax=Sphingomicrobium maritimum TaxID=3133972 RepID=UPI0031CC545F
MIKKTVLLAATALGLSACATYDDGMAVATAPTMGNTAPEGTIDPAVWRVADEDTTVYMLGTFHLLPEGYQWRTDTIDAALAESDEVYFEIADDLSNPAALQPLITELAIDPSQPTLAARIGEEYATRVATMVEPLGIPAQALNVMDTWFVGLTLSNAIAMKAGMTGESGVEMTLRTIVEERGLPIKGLETAREQLSYLDTMSAEAQREFILEGLEDTSDEEILEMFSSMQDSWARGDEQAIGDVFNEGMEIGGEVRSALLTRRNTDWTGDIIQRMGQPGTVFVAVGAGHLVGDDSVVAMLRQRGYTVTRIDD